MQEKKTKFKITKVESIDDLIKSSEEREKRIKDCRVVAVLILLQLIVTTVIGSDYDFSILLNLILIINAENSIIKKMNKDLLKMLEILSIDTKENITKVEDNELDNNTESSDEISEAPAISFTERNDMTESAALEDKEFTIEDVKHILENIQDGANKEISEKGGIKR